MPRDRRVDFYPEEIMDDDADADNCQCSTVLNLNIEA